MSAYLHVAEAPTEVNSIPLFMLDGEIIEPVSPELKALPLPTTTGFWHGYTTADSEIDRVWSQRRRRREQSARKELILIAKERLIRELSKYKGRREFNSTVQRYVETLYHRLERINFELRSGRDSDEPL